MTGKRKEKKRKSSCGLSITNLHTQTHAHLSETLKLCTPHRQSVSDHICTEFRREGNLKSQKVLHWDLDGTQLEHIRNINRSVTKL